MLLLRAVVRVGAIWQHNLLVSRQLLVAPQLLATRQELMARQQLVTPQLMATRQLELELAMRLLLMTFSASHPFRVLDERSVAVAYPDP